MVGNRLFLLGQSTSLLGDGLAVLSVPLLVLQLTASPVLSALAAAPRVIGYLIAGLPAGPLVDHTNPWRVLLAADAVRMAVFVLMAMALVIGRCPVAAILALAGVAGVATVFFETALAVAIRDIYTGTQLLRVNGFLETSGQLSLVLGPATVGVLIAAAGQQAALLTNAATFAISALTVWTTYQRLQPPEFTKITSIATEDRTGTAPNVLGSLGTEFRAGLRYLLTEPFIAGITALQVMTSFGLATETLIPFFAHERLGASSALMGLVLAGGGVGGAFGALITAAIGARWSPIPACLTAALIMALGLTSAGFAPGLVWLAAANALLAGASMVVVVVVRTLRQQVVPRALLGRVTSAARSLVLVAAAAGTMLAGVLTRFGGDNPRPVFIGAAVFVAGSTALVWMRILGPLSHRLRKTDRSDQCAPISS
ncbi:MFS transporter [Nocardia jejuensis]|uniref:MFS transporter n=1 Tax=Nocardia jejuensis TaxID=328049 RepID=UPI0009FD3E73|nr:MFS transporter [Nocardia jejuensis]